MQNFFHFFGKKINSFFVSLVAVAVAFVVVFAHAVVVVVDESIGVIDDCCSWCC